jgi:putative membrane protein
MIFWKIVHILGIILWTGGLMNLTRMISFHLQEEVEVQKRLYYIENRIYKFVTLPGLFLTIVAGLMMLTSNTGFYMKQPWFHAKLTFVLILLIMTGTFHRKLSELATKHEKQSPVPFKIIHGLTGLMLILILVMIYARPWAKVLG